MRLKAIAFSIAGLTAVLAISHIVKHNDEWFVITAVIMAANLFIGLGGLDK